MQIADIALFSSIDSIVEDYQGIFLFGELIFFVEKGDLLGKPLFFFGFRQFAKGKINRSDINGALDRQQLRPIVQQGKPLLLRN